MVETFSYYYLSMYSITVIAVFILIFNLVPMSFMKNYSIQLLISYLTLYVPLSRYFFLLVITLTGLPPVGLFLIKFNIISLLMLHTSTNFSGFVFVLFLLNIIFYSQLLLIKNLTLNIFYSYKSDIFYNYKLSNLIEFFKGYYYYKAIFFVNYILAILLFNIFLYNDIYLLILN